MNNKRKLIAILVAVPWLILGGMIFKAYLPIFTGRQYLLPVKARDPRDFFRGNYVSLQYEFSNLPLKTLKHDLRAEKKYRFGDTLWLTLRETEGALSATGLYAERKPDAAIVLKVQPASTLEMTDTNADLFTGLESFFAPKAEALDWESALREGRVFARVSIDHSGNARLTGLELKDGQKKARGEDQEEE